MRREGALRNKNNCIGDKVHVKELIRHPRGNYGNI